MLANDDQATSGGTTSGTVSRTSKPFEDALTTSAEAGAETAIANKARYFIGPPQYWEDAAARPRRPESRRSRQRHPRPRPCRRHGGRGRVARNKAGSARSWRDTR